jgi:restriction endonuclease S subunit
LSDGSQVVAAVSLVNWTLLRVPVPDDIPEQCRIAAVLDAMDQAIAKTKALIAKLRQVRAGLL